MPGREQRAHRQQPVALGRAGRVPPGDGHRRALDVLAVGVVFPVAVAVRLVGAEGDQAVGRRVDPRDVHVDRVGGVPRLDRRLQVAERGRRAGDPEERLGLERSVAVGIERLIVLVDPVVGVVGVGGVRDRRVVVEDERVVVQRPGQLHVLLGGAAGGQTLTRRTARLEAEEEGLRHREPADSEDRDRDDRLDQGESTLVTIEPAQEDRSTASAHAGRAAVVASHWVPSARVVRSLNVGTPHLTDAIRRIDVD